MGNTSSSKFCSKQLAEQLISPVKNGDIKEINQNEWTEKMPTDQIESSPTASVIPDGYLGRFFMATVKTPSPPSLINDSLNLLGINSAQLSKGQTVFSSRDWVQCKDFLITNIIKHYDKASVETEQEKEKLRLSQHIDTYGWVETTYPSTELLRGEIVCPSKFIIELFIDRPDLQQSSTVQLPPFNIDDDSETIIEALSTAISTLSFPVPLSVLSEVFTSQDSINSIIVHGHISGIIADSQIYYKASVKYP